MDVALSSDSPTHSAGGSLAGGGFLGLLSTQFLTALNDNIFRWLVIGISKDIAPEQIDNVLMAGTAAFVLPYLALAAPAGYMADRFPKRSVIVGCKIAEVLIMVLGVGAILYGGTGSGSGSLMPLVLMMVTVALLGSQAAMFSPARAGSIPELLKPELISKANGLSRWRGDRR
jgi:acyl-[acyl-carrier-protein]-phospholipid O-acyltransferase/long-chain-fatty-acid--[acyl-carrier-protein] ligase